MSYPKVGFLRPTGYTYGALRGDSRGAFAQASAETVRSGYFLSVQSEKKIRQGRYAVICTINLAASTCNDRGIFTCVLTMLNVLTSMYSKDIRGLALMQMIARPVSPLYHCTASHLSLVAHCKSLVTSHLSLVAHATCSTTSTKQGPL